MRVLIDVANGRISEDLLATLVRAGYTVERGAAQVAARRFDVVVVGSVEAAERLRREHPAVAVIVFTRTGDVEARIRALEAGAHDAVDADFAMSQVAARVGAAGRRAALVPRPPPRRLLRRRRRCHARSPPAGSHRPSTPSRHRCCARSRWTSMQIPSRTSRCIV